ncbi:MAG: leucine-rich repeat domain-containing protein [Firmicutes bacterium]|nr:leucine-rich repeat domain-containing protein [Bacillota bacterium]
MSEEKTSKKKLLIIILFLLLILLVAYIAIKSKKPDIEDKTKNEDYEYYYDDEDNENNKLDESDESTELPTEEVSFISEIKAPAKFTFRNTSVNNNDNSSSINKTEFKRKTNNNNQNVKLEIKTSYDRLGATYETVTVTITSNKKLKQLDGWTLSEDGLTLTKEYNQNIKEKIKVTDIENQQKEVNISINNIFTPEDEKVGEDGRFIYIVLESGKIQLIRYIGTETNLTIPHEYDGYEVYSVGNAYQTGVYNIFGTTSTSNTTIKSITIEDGIKAIERSAFAGCTGITSELNLPDSIERIEYKAFNKCSGLTGNLNLPSSLKTIGPLAFSGCSKLTGDIVIPDNVEIIENGVFQSCSSLNGQLILPSTIKYIGRAAFNGCSNLKGDLIIPDNVTYIGDGAFQSCSKLNGTLHLPSKLTYIGSYAFNGCNNLKGDLNIPEGVKEIGEVAFQKCSGFDGYLTLPSTLESIGNFAFNQCLNLKNETIVIPKSVKTIGASSIEGTHVFYATAQYYHKKFAVDKENKYFKAIDDVLYTIDGTRMIDYPNNKSNDTYEMPEGVKYLDQMSFGRNQYIKKLILPDSFVLSTTIPQSFTGNMSSNTLAHALYIYTAVEEISVKETNPNYKTIDGILYSKDGKELWYIPTKKSGTITIADGVETLRGGSLDSVKYNTNITVIIPKTVVNVDESTVSFMNDVGPTRILFEEGSRLYFTSNGRLARRSQ